MQNKLQMGQNAAFTHLPELCQGCRLTHDRAAMTAQLDPRQFGPAAFAGPALPIFHLHIPKTGGQSFGQRLAAGVAPGRAWYMKGDITSRDSELVDRLAKTMAVISAHPETGVLEHESRFAFAALVRDPVEQIVSNYLHVLRDPANEFHQLFTNLPAARAVELSRGVFANFQTRSLVTSFFSFAPSDMLLDEERFLTARLLDAADRLEWLAPTEALDELCILMALQTGHDFTRQRGVVNGGDNGTDPRAADLRELLRERPELYALDLLLHQEARRRLGELRTAVLRSARAPAPLSWQPGMIHAAEGESIQALEGWWQPFNEIAGWGLELRAGPGLASRLRLRRRAASRWLCFDIAFVAGIKPEELRFIDAQRARMLPFRVLGQGKTVSVAIDLSETAAETEIVMRAPRIYPLARFDGCWRGSDILVSLSTGRWRFIPDLPDESA